MSAAANGHARTEVDRAGMNADRRRRVRRSVARISPLLAGRRWAVVVIALGATGAGVAEAALLALIAQIAGAMSNGGTQSATNLGPMEIRAGVGTLLIVAAVLTVVRLALQVVVARLPARLSGAVQSHLRARLFNSFVAASWKAKAQEREGHLQELMGMQVGQAGGAVLQLSTMLSASLMFASLAVSAFVLSVTVAAAVLATAIALFAALRPLSRRVRRRSAATSAASLAQAHGVAESVRMAEEIHVFGVADAERSRVRRLIGALERDFVRTRSLSALVPVLYQGTILSLLVAGLALLYALGATQIVSLGAVVLLLVRASSYGQQLQTAYQSLGESLPYLDRVTHAIDEFRGVAARRGDRRIESIRTLEFIDVSFSYHANAPLLRDLSFSIGTGEAVGVVGPTGAGKSTILQLLLRLREPTHGRYLVNAMPAAEIENEQWHRKVAYLPQEPHLLHATVADNIRFLRDWVTEDAIERAARLAHIHEEIESWADGYETLIGQRADAVSGGQRQRLCLARCIAGSPELLILDEPTSSLDAQSERLIQESLTALRGTLTIIVVAHRVTTLDLCDRVMVVRAGRLEAFEPAASLYASNEFFRGAVDLATTGTSASR
jgi:ATP-binding cassette subfamily B protein